MHTMDWGPDIPEARWKEALKVLFFWGLPALVLVAIFVLALVLAWKGEFPRPALGVPRL